jgi:hypothetical protein
MSPGLAAVRIVFFLLAGFHPCTQSFASAANDQATGAQTAAKPEPAAMKEEEDSIRLELARTEATLGKEHPKVAALLRDLSELLVKSERLSATEPPKRAARITEAQSLMRRALATDEAAMGDDHPVVASDLRILANSLTYERIFMGKWEHCAETEAFARRALAIDEARTDEKNRDVARDLQILAGLMIARQRWAEAESFARRALPIIEETSGKGHPDTFGTRHVLALSLNFLRRYAEAEELHRAALAHAEAAFWKDDPRIAPCIGDIVHCLERTQRMAEAEPLIRRKLAIDEATRGKVDREVAEDLRLLADAVIAARRPMEAEPILLRALAIDEAVAGGEGASVHHDLRMLADLLESTERSNKAEPVRQRILAISITTLQKKKITVADPYLEGSLRDYRKLITRLENKEAFRPKLESLMQECGLDEATKQAVLKLMERQLSPPPRACPP